MTIKRLLLALLLAVPVAAANAQAPAAKPPAEAPAAKPAAEPPQAKILQEVFDCISGELPADWRAAWVNVLEVGRSADRKTRSFEANMRYTNKEGDYDGEPLKPCDSAKVIQAVGDLNEFLKPEERAWTVAQLIFLSDGKFEIRYDYTPVQYDTPAEASKPGAIPAATPAAKPAARPGGGFKLKTQ